jgi:DNA polymerase, archaea type
METAERTSFDDEMLWGWDDTPGIVSVWAGRSGDAVIWRRENERVVATHERWRPWVYATSLHDFNLAGVRPHEASPGPDNTLLSYHALPDERGTYRFVLSGRTWQALERPLVRGASRRLGRNVGSLHDLGDAYYHVGPVEQYLMLTGRTYFRGMDYADLVRLQFDLETTALDPARGRIFMVAVRDNRGLATTLEAASADDECTLIADLCALVQDRDPDIIENHNLHGFDLPFLVTRAEALGVPLVLGRAAPPGVRLPALERYGERAFRRRQTRYSVPGRELIDTLDAVWRYDFAARDLPSHRLKDVARHFGVARPDRVYLSGAEVYATFRSDPATVRRYALDDVEEVEQLSPRLLGAAFALAGMAPRRYDRLASAGPAMGILEPMLVRAYLRAGVALPSGATEGESSEPHAGGGLHLFASGVAEHVVKADIASLYPSLMRAYRIGARCDHLDVLLRLVDRLTDLRLRHKAAARTAERGSLAAARHNATQAAMKVLINSAYGYMGAGSMALFADRDAADEITRRGRDILAQVVQALRERGMCLIEADTDGVYFAVPATWTEHDERALVAVIGAGLPNGITLEYEGRYRAMFSHEVKNYALLGYDGTLVVRGGALRSSRAEPFGERFLRAALRCAMQGDIVGLRREFCTMVAAIRNRELPSADVASRVRLTKSPQTYLERRSGHQEAQYEALLAAGRTAWSPDERVRFYRVRENVFRWLPDETDDPPDDVPPEDDWDVDITAAPALPDDPRDYDAEHYVQVLLGSYAGRLRKAFAPEDFEQLFRLDDQLNLFDRPIADIEPRWIRCDAVQAP